MIECCKCNRTHRDAVLGAVYTRRTLSSRWSRISTGRSEPSRSHTSFLLEITTIYGIDSGHSASNRLCIDHYHSSLPQPDVSGTVSLVQPIANRQDSRAIRLKELDTPRRGSGSAQSGVEILEYVELGSLHSSPPANDTVGI